MVRVQESLVETVPYATRPRGGRYCIPNSEKLEALVLSDDRALGPWSSNRLRTVIGTLGHLQYLLFCATLLALVLGHAFIFGIKHCPYQLAKIFLIPLGIMGLLAAIAFTLAIILVIDPNETWSAGFTGWYRPKNPLYHQFEWSKAGFLSIFAGLVCWLFTGGVFGMAYSFKSIGITDLMNCSFETFKAVPGLMYVPVVEGLAKFLVFWLGLQGFSVISSEGWVEKNRIHVNGAKFAGLSREFIPATSDTRFYLMAIVWIVLFAWMMEFCNACGQFVTSYCTFKYYAVEKEKNKKKPPTGNVACEGLRYALIYHIGSVLKGALIIPWYRPARIINWLTSEISGGKSGATSIGGKFFACITGVAAWGVGAGVGGFLGITLAYTLELSWEWVVGLGVGFGLCFSFCFASSLASLPDSTKEIIEDEGCPTKDAFSDVVIRANDFSEGVEKAHNLLEHNHRIVQHLYRDHSQTTINVIGVASIAGICAVTVYLFVANLDIYKEPMSTLYVADPILVTILTLILTGYVAFGFMTLWDHTADTLLYCYAWSRRWDRKTVDKYIPETLRYIVGFDDVEHDRYPYYGKAKTAMYLRTWLPMVGMEDPKKKKAKAEKNDTSAPPTAMQSTTAPMGMGMGRRDPSAPDASFLSGFGTGFGAWGRQQQAISGDVLLAEGE